MKKLFTLFLFALLAITSAWAADYSLVTSASDLAAGDVIVIASSSNLMSTTQNNNNRSATTSDVTFSEDKKTVSVTGSNVEVITLEAGTKTGTFAFKVTNGYLYAASSSKNYLRTKTTKDANGSATISINSDDGEATITFQGDNTRNLLQYNASNSLFACYDPTNPQQPVYIYKAASSGKTATSLSFGADWDGKKITKYIGENDFPCPTATLTPAVDGAAITYASDNENVAAIVDGTIMLGDVAGKATITASYAGNDTYDASSASFTIDLQKLPVPTFSEEDGAYVEKGSVVNLYVPSTPAFCKIMCTINDVDEIESSGPVSIPINATTKIFAFTVCTIDGVQVTSEGVTKTYYAKELSSIAISGTPSKTTYAPGDVFSTDGLTVTATYNNGSTADVTSDVAWSFDPATFTTEGSQNVAVTATYNGKTATENYTVTVTAPSVSTNTYTLVTSNKDLKSGAKYVLLTTKGGNAASSFDKDKITVVTATDNYKYDSANKCVTILSDKVNVFTFTGDAANGWTITDKDGVTYGSSDSDTKLSSNPSTFNIAVSSTGSVAISVGTDRTWRFNSDMIRNYASSTGTLLYLYKEGAVVAAPTFDPVSGTAFDTETATITITAPVGCTLKYTVGSGEEQTSDSNTAEVTVSPTAYTITAKSVDAEGVESNEATATYTFTPHVKNIAEFLALPDKTTAIFNNSVVVLYDYSQPSNSGTNCEYIWVKDESGQTNLYLPEAFDGTNHVAHYENGDVIPAGFKATKNLYDKGNFYQALVDATNKATLQVATLKRLADPVTITFSEFSALGSDDLAKWNNTYVMIPRVNFSKKSVKQYIVSQDGTPATSSVFYNKYSDEGAKKKDGTSAVVEMRNDGASVEYNVYGILQVYNNIWEIMPIRFVEYSAQTVTLKELVELGNVNSTKETTEYTILNDLRGVRALSDNMILAKDENGNAVDKVTPAGNSFMINAKSKFDDAATVESVNAKAQEDYDQSNWVEIVLPEGVSADSYVDRIITGLSVKGYYKNTTNPRLEASAAPTAGGATGAYTRNAMCPANFMGTSQKCNDETLTQEHGDFFFMTPKPNECVQVVWAVYNSSADAFYIPAAQGSINSHGFKGAFSIDWAYNADGKITNLTDGNLYQFAAVVKKPEPAPQSPKRKIACDNTQPLSTDYVVFPLNLDANYVTGITETTGTKTVKSVRYFNIMGVELAEPTAGVNIVLTTYTDGTTHSQKILK